MTKVLRLLAAALPLVACAPPEDVDRLEQAATVPPGTEPTPPYNPCAYHLTGTADRTITMGDGISEGIATLVIDPTPVTYWPQPQCTAWEFDVVLPHGAGPDSDDCGRNGCYPWAEINAGAMQFPGSTMVEGGFYVPTSSSTEQHCESFRNTMSIYKKAAGTSSFVLVKSLSYHGTWTSNGGCVVKAGTNGYYPNDLLAPSPPGSGTDVYRILTSVTVDGSYRSMRVKVDYEEM
jgi:hypothetical protein